MFYVFVSKLVRCFEITPHIAGAVKDVIDQSDTVPIRKFDSHSANSGAGEQ